MNHDKFITFSELNANRKIGWFTQGDRVYQHINITKGTQRFVGILVAGNGLVGATPLANTDVASKPKSSLLQKERENM
jgi:hypothetical protein